MWESNDPKDLRIVVLILRALANWDNTELSAASGVSRNMIAKYLEGERAPSRRTLERLAKAVRFPLELLEPLISLVRVLRLAWEEARSRPEAIIAVGRKADALSESWVSAAGALYLAQLGAFQQEGEPEAVRREAKEACLRLRALPSELRRVAVPVARSLHNWGVVEFLCAESEATASHHTEEALELAELALLVARQLPPSIRSLAQAYAWGFLGNAHRVGGKLSAAAEAFSNMKSLCGRPAVLRAH
jgi:transcriptional regulator with XRE-family HTH domain